jgi:hypothetical protein
MHSRERHLGGQLTTHALMFAPPDSFEKPEFARKPLIRCATPAHVGGLNPACRRTQCPPSPVLHRTLNAGRDGFYRKTNIMFPPGCDATTAS